MPGGRWPSSLFGAHAGWAGERATPTATLRSFLPATPPHPKLKSARTSHCRRPPLPRFRGNGNTPSAVYPFGRPYPKECRSGRPVLFLLSSGVRSVASQPYCSVLIDSHLALRRFLHGIGSWSILSNRITRLQRHRESLQHVTSATVPRGYGVGSECCSSPWAQASLLAYCLDPVRAPITTPVERWPPLSFATPAASAFLSIMASRLPPWLFQGLLSVRSRYSPHEPLTLEENPFLKCCNPLLSS